MLSSRLQQVVWTWPCAGRRGKFDLARVPPWRRWPRDALLRLPLSRFPEVEPSVDIKECNDPAVLADTICEVAPWRRRREHQPWLLLACRRVQALLPDMTQRDIVRVALAFGELYTKRRTNTLLFHDYETYTQLFQAMSTDVVTAKTLLPLLRVYRRMDVIHQPFVRAACDRVVRGTIELSPDELAELVKLMAELKIMAPPVFEFAIEVLDLKFAHFSEDNVGDIVRAFCSVRYRCQLLFTTFKRELPFRLHEYAWWNLVDIAELYLLFQVDDPEIVKRIGNETFKHLFSMHGKYPAKALKALAFLEAADKRTFRLLLRQQLRCVKFLDPLLAADSIMACVALKVEPGSLYHNLKGSRLYHHLIVCMLDGVGKLSAKKTCDVVAALAKARFLEIDIWSAVSGVVAERPYKFHTEHLISLLRDFGAAGHKDTFLRTELLHRSAELAECTPSALCSLPSALAAHRDAACIQDDRRYAGHARSMIDEEEILQEASRLLCTPDAYRLPENPRDVRSKDDFWWKNLRQRHFRLRRRAAATGVAVEPVPPGADPIEDSASSGAIAHVTKEECLQLLVGCYRLHWRDEKMLEGITSWLCEGRRHAELQPTEVATALEAFAGFGFSRPLLRSSLEHALLRVAADMPASDWPRTLRGALALGISVRGAAMRALVRRCTSDIAFVPPAERTAFRDAATAVLEASERETVAALSSGGALLTRLPMEMQMLQQVL